MQLLRLFLSVVYALISSPFSISGQWTDVPLESVHFPPILLHEAPFTPEASGDWLGAFHEPEGKHSSFNHFDTKVALSMNVLYPNQSHLHRFVDHSNVSHETWTLQDVDYYDGWIYASINKYHHDNGTAALVVFHAYDLSFADIVIPLPQTSASWIAIDQSDGKLYSSERDNVSTLYQYQIDTNTLNWTSSQQQLPLERVVHRVEAGVVQNKQLKLRVNRQIDHECNALVVSLPQEPRITTCEALPIASYSSNSRLQSPGIPAKHTCELKQALVLPTLAYYQCHEKANLSALNSPNWGIIHLIARSYGISEDSLSSPRTEKEQFPQLYLYVKKNISGFEPLRMLHRFLEPSNASCEVPVVPDRATIALRPEEPWFSGACPFKNQEGSPCYAGANACLGFTHTIPAADQQRLCQWSVWNYCVNINPTHIHCNSIDPKAYLSKDWFVNLEGRSCPFPDTPSSPCYTGGNPCLGNGPGLGPQSVKCVARIRSYCTIAANAETDIGCQVQHPPLVELDKKVHAVYNQECPFATTHDLSPCKVKSNPCLDKTSSREACVSYIEDYCYIQSAANATYPPMLRTDDPACIKNSWWWWESHPDGTCPFRNVPGSPCFRRGCLQVACTVGLTGKSSRFMCDIDRMNKLTKSFEMEGNPKFSMEEGQCIDEMDEYCRAVGPEDPACQSIHKGCNVALANCPFINIPGSPCCWSERSNPCTLGYDLQNTSSSNRLCMEYIQAYCQRTSAPELLHKTSQEVELVFPTSADTACINNEIKLPIVRPNNTGVDEEWRLVELHAPAPAPTEFGYDPTVIPSAIIPDSMVPERPQESADSIDFGGGAGAEHLWNKAWEAMEEAQREKLEKTRQYGGAPAPDTKDYPTPTPTTTSYAVDEEQRAPENADDSVESA